MPKKITKEEYIRKFITVHGDKYDYSLVDYKNNDTKVIIICKKHGQFLQKPKLHFRGSECPKCYGSIASNIKASEVFIQKSIYLHGNKYDYSLVQYKNSKEKVIIICKKHGQFLQTPNHHLRGCGCPKCSGNISRNIKAGMQFIQKSTYLHNNKYDYSLVHYKNNDTKVIIICKKHGQFSQVPASHLKGRGCPKCSNNISSPETKWLNSLNLPNDKYHRQVRLEIDGKKIVVDGYDPTTKTVYEFHGDYWHGNLNIYKPQDKNKVNKKTFEELFLKTTKRSQLIKKAGYNLVSIWESAWKKSKMNAEENKNMLNETAGGFWRTMIEDTETSNPVQKTELVVEAASVQNLKVCSKCNLPKDIKEYAYRSLTTKKLHSQCKSCTNVYQKAIRNNISQKNSNKIEQLPLFSQNMQHSAEKATCGSCKQVKLITEFSKNNTRRTGVQSWCKKCHSQRSKNEKPNQPVDNSTDSYNIFSMAKEIQAFISETKEKLERFSNILNVYSALNNKTNFLSGDKQ